MSNAMRLYTPLKNYCDPFICHKPGPEYPYNVMPVKPKPKQIKEKFGAFSISGAVYPPYSPGRSDPNYKQPKLMGVN